MNSPRFTVIIQWSDEGQVSVASLPEWGPACKTRGTTYEEAARNAREGLEILVGSHDLKLQGPLPAPKLFHYPGADVVNLPEDDQVGSTELTPRASRDLVKATKAGRIVLTRGGKPVAYVLPTSIYDEEDIGYMTDPAFWSVIRERRREDADSEMIPLEEIEAEIARLEHGERQSKNDSAKSGKKKSSPNGRKGSPGNATA